MSTLYTTAGKLLCMTLLIVPCTTIEAKRKEDPWELSSRTGSYSPFHAYNNNRTAASFSKSNLSAASKAAAAKMVAAAKAAAAARAAARKAELRMAGMEALALSSELQLADSGLDQKVLETALMGYHRLIKKGIVRRSEILSVCDFSQPSSQKRMYIIDMRNRKLLYRCYVAHGESSGATYADSFSNLPESHKSSLGFYVTRATYNGGNGLSLRIDGLDRGFNSLANERNIVIHGAPYVSERILHKYGVMGTTFGCPAIPEELTNQIIPLLQNGTCFFIYYPSQKYFSQSSVLN